MSTLHRLGVCALFAIALAQDAAPQPAQATLPPAQAFDRPEQTRLGRQALAAAQAHGGNSGFFVQNTGAQAFAQRAALIEAAEASIDAQYYIWNSDLSGRYLAQRLLLAADRGVQVRVLLDDFNNAGRDELLAALDSHPGIQIRIYNPFATRAGPGRLLDAIVAFDRLNRRMHNKTFVVDGAVGIVGGRNIGDEYFGLHAEMNFRDRDLMAVGPIVRDISNNFDSYWNSRLAAPIDTLAEPVERGAALEQLSAQALAATADTGVGHYKPARQADAALADLARWFDELEWALAELVFSEPVIGPLNDGNTPARTAERLAQLMRASEHEILMESAYFILGKPQLDGIRQLSARGITIKALTNSLASNDLVGNHAGYARTRTRVLTSGIELYELRPDAQDCAQWRGQVSACDGAASLHSKTMVFDRSIVYVGSFNLNLRSIYLNGETALILHSSQLAERIALAIERAMQPANSWQVRLTDSDTLQWTGVDGVYDREPATGLWRRIKAGFWALLPIEKYY